uniref:Uncharacterized protein n=1 Tax=Romanomermis culicivorax TaxID=13658 RepID=A0A915I753_ROMCU
MRTAQLRITQLGIDYNLSPDQLFSTEALFFQRVDDIEKCILIRYTIQSFVDQRHGERIPFFLDFGL